MPSIFQGLELAKQALLSQQFTLNTIGHNIANAATPGYSRQRVHLTTADPVNSPVGPLGTGTQVAWVRSQRDLFLTGQYRQANEQRGRWEMLERSLSQVEIIFNEPSDQGLNRVLGDFFAAWHTLSQNPESSAARASVREQATTLTNTFRQLSRRLDDLERGLDQQVGDKVAYINQTASEISLLNKEIGRSEIGGKQANDLRDRRDYLIDQLSSVVNVRTLNTKQGYTRVFLGSMEIVGGINYTSLGTKTVKIGTMTRETVVWKSTSITVKLTGGELSGLQAARDDRIPAYRGMLDDLAASVVAQINQAHASGFSLDGTTGINFFNPNGVTAASIEVDTGVRNDLTRISASLSGAVGDNANAIIIANLQNSLVLNDGTATFSDFYAQIIGGVGRNSADAINEKANSDLVLKQIEFSRQSIQGVSLDEEMINLIKAQHAYDAAARVIATIDRALNTLINDMGVGR